MATINTEIKPATDKVKIDTLKKDVTKRLEDSAWDMFLKCHDISKRPSLRRADYKITMTEGGLQYEVEQPVNDVKLTVTVTLLPPLRLTITMDEKAVQQMTEDTQSTPGSFNFSVNNLLDEFLDCKDFPHEVHPMVNKKGQQAANALRFVM